MPDTCPNCGTDEWYKTCCTHCGHEGYGEFTLKCTNGHDLCYLGTDDKCQYCERVYD